MLLPFPTKASATLLSMLGLTLLILGVAAAHATEAPAIVSLGDINRDADGDRVTVGLGDTATVRAVVIIDPFEIQPGPMYRVYLDDGSGGLMLQTTNAALVEGIGTGDVVLVEGLIDFYQGSNVVIPNSVEVVGTGDVPPPIEVTVNDLVSEKYEGRRIRVRGKLVNAQNVELVDATGSIRVRARRILLEDPEFKRRLYSEANVEVVGIASQYDPSPPHDAGYRIEMLSTEDLALKVDLRPYGWGLGVALVTGLFWWRARTATRREAYTRGLLEQVRASEQALKNSEEQLRVVADATSDVIWELDLVRRELFWRAGTKELFGVERMTRVPNRSTHLEFVHPDDAERVSESLASAIDAARDDWDEEYRVVREDGEIRYVSDRARILKNDDGTPDRVIGALVDVTERHRAAQRERELQTNLQHAQRLESLGILSSGIAHDFNNILAAIVGNADMLLESGELEPGQRALLREITTSCERGVDLTGKMLTYAGRAPTEQKSVDVNQLIEDVLAIVSKAVPKSVVLKSELDPRLPSVDGDPAQLQQVVMNFVTNAVESLTEGIGEVCVTTATRDVDSVKGQLIGTEFRLGRYVTLQVSDTGRGIDPSQAAKIFEPFYTTKSSGRGLGLSAVVGIINNHNGCMFVDSVPGKGTTFEVLLPPGRIKAGEAEASSAPNTSRPRGAKVLVADDEEMIRRVVADALAPLDLTVELVEDGRQALERILANRDAYDLLVLDVSMPGLDGDKVFARVRDAGIRTPVLFMSGHGAYDLEQRVGDAEEVAILAKPFRIQTLRDRCLELLEHNAGHNEPPH